MANRTREEDTKWIQNLNVFISPTALFMSEKSKFRLRLPGFGELHHFTHAKTHRAGGFYNQERGPCALIHNVELRLFTLAFHTQISLLSRCQVDFLMRG